MVTETINSSASFLSQGLQDVQTEDADQIDKHDLRGSSVRRESEFTSNLKYLANKSVSYIEETPEDE